MQSLDTTPDRQILNFVPSIPNEITYLGDNTFQFLNLQKSFGEQIDWEFVEFGRLWGYNLNYFEFLNQKGMDVREGKKLIQDFIQHFPKARMGMEPYPLSLRSINWIRFLSCNGINDVDIDAVLYAQLNLLIHKLEYHLLGKPFVGKWFCIIVRGLLF